MTNEVTETGGGLPMEILEQMATAQEVSKKEVVAKGEWIPSLQIIQALSKLRSELKVDEGTMILRARKPIVLPATIDFMVVAHKVVAKDFSGDDPIFSTDSESDLFKDIKERSTEKDSNCAFGNEYLCYSPDFGYFTWHATNATLRNTCSLFDDKWGQKFSVHTEQTENRKRQKWFAPVVGKCGNVFDSPSQEDLKATYYKWLKSLDKNGEVDEETPAGSREN
jgi:hypothetical protein